MITFFLLVALAKPIENPVPIGTKIVNVTFKDIRYLPRSLDDFSGKKAFVLVFVERSCPVAKRYLPILKELDGKYSGLGVQFLAVNPSPEDTIVEMAGSALEAGVGFPFVKDFGGAAAKKLGVERVPTAVVLNGERVLVYRGRIDDQIRLGGARTHATRHDLKSAIDDVLAGKAVGIPETVVDGCPITFPSEVNTEAKHVTYAEHVAPILKKQCIECHAPGRVAPFALMTYEQAKARASVLAEVVQEERMPPWYAHPEHGKFINQRKLTGEEKQTILNWVKQGRPGGDMTHLAPPRVEAVQNSEWLIDKPDLVLATQTYDLKETGDIPYEYAILPYFFAADTWVKEIQIRPDNPKVVHHSNLAYFVVGEKFSMNNFLTGFVPGGEPMRLEPGVAAKIPKGSVLGLQIHFVSTGKPEKGRVQVGLRMAREEVKKQLHFRLLADRRFAIPPGATAHRVSSSWTIPEDVVGIGLFSHMHVRGRDMSFFATKPGQQQETLLMIPNYSFDWQMPYVWASGATKFPAGTKLDCIAHYDNSAFNPYNPNPQATVREGQQTHEEMMNGFFFYISEKENLGIKLEGATGRPTAKK